jgi:hypothetical protein
MRAQGYLNCTLIPRFVPELVKLDMNMEIADTINPDQHKPGARDREQPSGRMATVRLGGAEVTRFILGGNPQSGISHVDKAVSDEMRHYYTTERVKALYRRAERLGVKTHIGRADHHIIRVLLEYWDEGGAIQWIAQTCPEIGSPECGANNGIRNGAKAVFIHGGVTDNLLHHGRLQEVQPVINMVRDAGLPCGMAGHMPATFEYAEEHIDCDFYMCSYYNPLPRDKSPEHVTQDEHFDLQDREKMTALIGVLSRPVIHYKIMASGRNNPREAFACAARAMRPTDAVCVGIYPKRRPCELAEDVSLLKEALAAVGQEC